VLVIAVDAEQTLPDLILERGFDSKRTGKIKIEMQRTDLIGVRERDIEGGSGVSEFQRGDVAGCRARDRGMAHLVEGGVEQIQQRLLRQLAGRRHEHDLVGRMLFSRAWHLGQREYALFVNRKALENRSDSGQRCPGESQFQHIASASFLRAFSLKA
jgi:hypothetical protein